MTTDDPSAYPGSAVLRNKLDLIDAEQLARMERLSVTQRAAEGIPSGGFDLAHLSAIHRHLFQDIHEWAGDVRTVEIAKGGHQFQFRRFIERGMQDIYQRLERANFLRGLVGRVEFAAAAGRIMGDVNYVHPFREGNGRAQLFYLERLAEQASHPMDLARLNPRRWIEASRASHGGDYEMMAAEIGRCLPGLAGGYGRSPRRSRRR